MSDVEINSGIIELREGQDEVVGETIEWTVAERAEPYGLELLRAGAARGSGRGLANSASQST